jgi:DNA-binding Lrp family transcriptional regulator
MDDLDRKLIAQLRDNARTPLTLLAKTLKVSRGTVQNRLEKLERDGTIAGFTVRQPARGRFTHPARRPVDRHPVHDKRTLGPCCRDQG